MVLSRTILKAIVIVFISTASLCVLIGVYLLCYYMETMPRVPQPHLGLIHPLNIHGTIVYITGTENDVLDWLRWGATVCGIGGGILQAVFKVFPGSKDSFRSGPNP